MEKTKKIGAPVKYQTNQFVQTDKSSHEAWSRLAIKDPKASALLHLLVSHMNQGKDPVVVVPQGLLGKMLGCSVRTVSRAVKRLTDENWIEAVKLGRGTVSAYRINSRAAWTASREDLKWSKFNSLIIADYADQTNLKDTELRKIPSMIDGEVQILTGEGEEPPSQPMLDGVESGLPTLTQHEQLEDEGQQRLLD